MISNWNYKIKVDNINNLNKKNNKNTISNYEFTNIFIHKLIKKIIIHIYEGCHANIISKNIFISFSDHHNNSMEKINKISEDIKGFCKNKNFVSFIPISKTIYLRSFAEFIFEEIIYYLEQLEEIHPIDILEKILYIGGGFESKLNYPKIFKNIINPDLTEINFGILKKLDKIYHDNFIELLDIDQKINILEYNIKNTFEYNYDFLETLINENLNYVQKIKIINLINKNEKYSSIYDNNIDLYSIYLNHLSIEEIFKKLNEKIEFNKAFEIVNYLYIQNNLTFDQNIELILIINNKFQYDDLNILKNKIICKLITDNTNLDNEVYNELSKYKDSTEALIRIMRYKK